MNRKILASLVIIGVTGAFAAGGTFALFNDTETSQDNTFAAGALDLKVDWNESYNGEVVETQNFTDNPGPIFDIEDLKPGDHGEATVSLHVFDNPGYLWMNVTQVAQPENGCTEPEAQVDPTCGNPGTGQGELGQNMYFTVWEDDGDNVRQSDEEIYFNGTAEALDDQMFQIGSTIPNSTQYVGLKWWVPKDVGNIIQTDGKEFRFDFYAEQARHNDANFTAPEEQEEDPKKDYPVDETPQNETEEDDKNCHYHGEGENKTQHCTDEDGSDETENENQPDTGNETDEEETEEDLSDIPGCQEGEVHIPEDTDCDGEIEDRFLGNGTEDENETETPTDENEAETPDEENESDEGDTVTEERQTTPAPEPDYVGDDYISYPNPRDHYLHSEGIHREGSMKVCKILLNQNGEVIKGSTIPDTTFSVDTSIGEVIPDYESDTMPVTFDTEIEHAADLIGTSPDLIEGDGQLDAECAEFHDLKLNQTYTYDRETISGPNADEVETVGYIEKWDNRRTPLANVEPYGTSDLSDGEVRLEPGNENRHAEVMVINQLK